MSSQLMNCFNYSVCTGRGIGSFLAMEMNTWIGTRQMFISLGFTGTGCVVLYYMLYHLVIKKTEPRKDPNPTEDEQIKMEEINVERL